MLTGVCNVCHETAPFEVDLAGSPVRCKQCGLGVVRIPRPADARVFAELGPTTDSSTAATDQRSAATEPQTALLSPTPISFDQRLRSATRWTPVTWTLVAANVALFTAMAATYWRLFYFSPDALLTWGGGLAPRLFGHEWWRAGSYLFVHGDLAHLASNLLFLLLVGPLVERLLGPVRFALVYLFAGLGGGLLMMGTYPQHVVVGASAAVFGVYGALLGCCLRGPRSIPWRVIARRGGLLLLYTAVSLLGQWLDFAQHPVGHLGGFVFGLVGGLLCGHRLQPRAARRWPWPLAVIAAVCVGLISLTAWWVHDCTAKARAYYARYAAARDRERELLGRFDDALHRWEQGKFTSAEWKDELEKKLIPAWQDARSSCGLKLTGELAELEQHSFTMQDFWSALRSMRGEPKSRDEKPLTVEEYGKMYCLLCKVRLDTWRALANDLPGSRVLTVRALMDERELELLFAALDDEVNEDNPLYRWFESTRRGSRRGGKEAVEPDLGLIKNRGFESGLDGWSRFDFGAPARFDFDTDVSHEGRQSLRISAAQFADTGCTQEVMLKPGRWYRFSGWVRTRGLVSHSSGRPDYAYGTFQIHGRRVNDVIARGTDYGGDTDWTPVRITFKTPDDDGLIRIVVYFAGFWGQGTGTAWFDDLKLVEVSEPAR
jgi:rhomboid protease GluP